MTQFDEDIMNDTLDIISNSANEDEARELFLNYIAGKKDPSLTKRKVKKILREQMEEDAEEAINSDDFKKYPEFREMTAKATAEFSVEYFMSNDNLRFKCGMPKEKFKALAEKIAAKVKKKYFGYLGIK